jgi:hypothetical protein
LTGAGFFILAFATLSLVALILTRFPERKRVLISVVLLFPVLALLLFVFRHTNSRGAFLAISVAFLMAAMMAPVKKNKMKMIGIGFVLLLIVPFLFTDILERSLKSMYFRFDYYWAAIKMFFHHPFVGVGWGDFFHEYMRLKTVPGSESPHNPHNFILNFASQAGLMGLGASLWVVVAPFILCWRFRGNREFNWLNAAILTGWLAWCVHSLIDFNIQVPGTVGVGIVLLLLLDVDGGNKRGLFAGFFRRPSHILPSDSNKSDHIPEIDGTATAEREVKRVGGSWIWLAMAFILAAGTLTISTKQWRADQYWAIKGEGAFGYNAETDTYEDLFKAGVIDPTKVTRIALENAASVAGLMITTEAMIATVEDDSNNAPAGMPQGMPMM